MFKQPQPQQPQHAQHPPQMQATQQLPTLPGFNQSQQATPPSQMQMHQA